MRSTSFYPLLLFLLPACQPGPSEKMAQQPTIEAASAPVAKTLPLTQQASPLISGYWISTRYLDIVTRTRSPALAIKDFPNYPATMLIEPAPPTADSTHAALVLDLHEGSDMTILFQPGTSATSLPVRTSLGEDATSYEVAYQVSATDTILYFVKRDRQQRELSRFAYRRVAQAKPSKDHSAQLNDEFAHTLNQLVLAGTYLGTDSLGRRVQAQFLPDGQVKGLPFRTYHILEDFLGGPTGGDALIFDTYQRDQQQFAADYGRDTLRLYEQYEAMGIPPGGTDSTLTIKRGRLRYQLVRSKHP